MARLLSDTQGASVLGTIDGKCWSHALPEALGGTRKRRPSAGKCLWTFVDLLGGPGFSLGLAGMMGPRAAGKLSRPQFLSLHKAL